MSTVEKIIEELKTLTLMEASELVKQIEETFGVDASAPVGGAVVMANQEVAGQEVKEEKTTFDVLVKAVAADKRVAVLKVLIGHGDVAAVLDLGQTLALCVPAFYSGQIREATFW